MQLSIGQAAAVLGVSVGTLRRWDKDGSLKPSLRTVGGHRRYMLESLEKIFLIDNSAPDPAKKKIAYARVSSHDQMKNLETQKEKLASYCRKEFEDFEIISDLGSGLNYKKPGLTKLMQLIFQGRISHLILNHKDRLLRFGSEIIFHLCKHHDVKVIILEAKPNQSFEVELASDVIELMTVFSARLYGRRSRKNQKAIAA